MECTCSSLGDDHVPQQSFAIIFLSNLGPLNPFPANQDFCCLLLCPGVDPGFLERGFVCLKVWGLGFLNLSHFP